MKENNKKEKYRRFFKEMLASQGIAEFAPENVIITVGEEDEEGKEDES